MINRKELEICKRHGHNCPDYGDGWMQCKWCGIRRRRVIEEREDEPPKEELNRGVRTDRKIDQLIRAARAGIAPPSRKARKRSDPRK
jgi:hypothetical protein